MASASSPSSGLSVEQALSQPVEELLPDASHASTSSQPPTNGSSATHVSKTSDSGHTIADSADQDDPSSMNREELMDELKRVREERDGFEGQYKGLLGKLTQMRSTLGDRLRQDAEELDRRESQIETLTRQVQELQASTSTLKSELISSHTESERVTRELDALRQSSAKAIEEATRAATAAASASSSSSADTALAEERDRLEMQVVHLNQSIESLKVQLSQQEAARKEDLARREETEAMAEQARMDKEYMEEEVSRWRGVAEREKESARNLQLVLEEFQNEQDAELQRAIGDYQHKYDSTAALLEEYKARAVKAEKQWLDTKDSSERGRALEQDVKEKNLLIGKLRHEAVILNEHLTEALRRLNQDNSSLTVDRRLVTNVLLQFLTTPRQDAKRFEMLSLLSSVLQWSDEEKEMAGIQRSGGGFGRRLFGGGAGTGGARSASSAGATAQDESFSNLFVEYLLSEADKAKTAPTSPSGTPYLASSSASAAAAAGTFPSSSSSKAQRSLSGSGGALGAPGSQTAPAGRTNFDMNALNWNLPPGEKTSSGGAGAGVGGVVDGLGSSHNMASSRRSGSVSTTSSPTRLKNASGAGVGGRDLWASPTGKTIQEEKDR
ncbi:hypothetical protein BCV69DRAFT_281049 [Microstroma glucosiphilum]|uniref:GRIP domain-containing protein n=1 Tax=Pseudomicrostroma glucosiphilum TaxID=1684307 RepID=A0A316UGE5_9BASI|nr:hypothetical protein BCV69DRAFT_281049 [Pseudomicrostroma glucosiphilum]PWN23431.1 hypothetical protein BCV69DRAFT_281049 [Pseudomicrostroma glucosiphilum]